MLYVQGLYGLTAKKFLDLSKIHKHVFIASHYDLSFTTVELL